jgi:hypothetical protein
LSPRSNDEWKHGDVVQNPLTGRHFVAEYDKYRKRCVWLELAPIGYSQLNPPADAVLVMRWVEGKPMPVVSLGDGDLFAIETVA